MLFAMHFLMKWAGPVRWPCFSNNSSLLLHFIKCWNFEWLTKMIIILVIYIILLLSVDYQVVCACRVLEIYQFFDCQCVAIGSVHFTFNAGAHILHPRGRPFGANGAV